MCINNNNACKVFYPSIIIWINQDINQQVTFFKYNSLVTFLQKNCNIHPLN